MPSEASPNTSKPAPKPLGKLVFGLVYVLIYPALLLFLSGDWLWVEGWIFFFSAAPISPPLHDPQRKVSLSRPRSALSRR